MSIIQKNLAIVESPAETLPEFVRLIDDPRIGLEVENHFVDKNLNAATVESYHALAAGVKGRADISLEAASTMFEVKNEIPKTPAQGAQPAADELIADLSVIEAQIHANDHIILPHSILPWSNFENLAKTHIHPGPNPRPTSFINYFMANRPEMARNFITVAGQQSSMTHRTPTDTLRYYNRLAHLAPLLATTMSTVPPYAVLNDGQFGAVKTNVSLGRRLQTGGGVQNAFPLLASVSAINDLEAEKFMKGWNDYVWDTQIFSYYDPDDTDEFKRLKHFEPQGTTISFRNLPKQLQTRENFNMASSIQYGLITMSHIPASGSRPDLRRAEARFYDTGSAGQIRSVAGLSFALAFDEEFGDRTDHFIRSKGFAIDTPTLTHAALMDTLQKVATLEFSDLSELPYGNASLLKAANDFHAGVIRPMLDDHPQLAHLSKLCEQGTSAALEFRKAITSEQDFISQTKARPAQYAPALSALEI